MSIFCKLVALGQGARDMAVPAAAAGACALATKAVSRFSCPMPRVLIIAVTVVLMIALTLYIRHSRMGRASRACSQDMHMARPAGH